MASGANDTLRFALESQLFYFLFIIYTVIVATAFAHLNSPRDFLRAFLWSKASCRSRSLAAACCSSSVRTATRVRRCDGEDTLDWTALDVVDPSKKLGEILPELVGFEIFQTDASNDEMFLGFSGVVFDFVLLGEVRRAP